MPEEFAYSHPPRRPKGCTVIPPSRRARIARVGPCELGQRRGAARATQFSAKSLAFWFARLERIRPECEAGYALFLSLVAGRVRSISATRAVVVGRGCGGTHSRCTDGRSAYAWAVVAPAVIAATSRHRAASIRYTAAGRHRTAAMRYSTAASRHGTAASRYGAAAGSTRREGVSRNTRDAHCGDHDK